MNVRAATAQVIRQVTVDGRSLSTSLPLWQSRVASADQPLLQELCYGVLRWLPRLEFLRDELLNRPLKRRDADVACLLLVGIYQLMSTRVPAHAAVAETVSGADTLDKQWARGMVNGVLRNFQRRRSELLASADREPAARFAHPPWLLDRFQRDWPAHWETVVQANNERPPMVLRVNLSRTTRQQALDLLAERGIAATSHPLVESAVQLQAPMDVRQLPGFAEGLLSVQDAGAQLAAPLLQLETGHRVLDACAAPGGKTAHLLEWRPAPSKVIAVDQEPERMTRVAENLNRLGYTAICVTADAGDPSQWWDGAAFDRILLDAPCSATGVIRRHPDIKVLRRSDDVPRLAAAQARLLDALWPLLRRGGILLYVTCSIIDEENQHQIGAFLGRHGDAEESPMCLPFGLPCSHGVQLLPGLHGTDGFYYARLLKR